MFWPDIGARNEVVVRHAKAYYLVGNNHKKKVDLALSGMLHKAESLAKDCKAAVGGFSLAPCRHEYISSPEAGCLQSLSIAMDMALTQPRLGNCTPISL
eukprot:scaffold249362_cov38-Prasinocladus_malaysianus.AAC.1